MGQLSFVLLPAQSWSREEGAANLKLSGDYRKWTIFIISIIDIYMSTVRQVICNIQKYFVKCIRLTSFNKMSLTTPEVHVPFITMQPTDDRANESRIIAIQLTTEPEQKPMPWLTLSYISYAVLMVWRGMVIVVIWSGL